jgi:RNA polymerase sigma-70 factor (ECF subfamily)
LSTSHKEDQRIIEAFLSGSEKECRIINQWISRVVQLNSWGLKAYSDDITQDVMIKLYNNLRDTKFRFVSSLKTYVSRITKFTCIDYLRKYLSKEQKEVELLEIPSYDNPESDLEQRQEKKILWRIYRLMSSECRDLWKMIFWENLSYLQIAQQLSIHEGTVKSRFSRCKEKAIGLRKKLTEKMGLF